jgi:ferritin-like metal-binding protein YciE
MPKNKTSKEKSLYDLLLVKMSALYDIEKQLVKALPKLAKAASDEELSKGFQDHLMETENHVRRLEDAFNDLGEKPDKKMKSAGIKGIIEDGGWVIKNIKPETSLDANLIAAASYAEHYEMAGYKAAITWAERLGLEKVFELLQATLQEEIAADEKLAGLAASKIDDRAIA